MDWNWLPDGSCTVASGDRNVYLLLHDKAGSDISGVRLTRYRARPNSSPAAVAAEAARNVIVFPLGRGPGRPAGVPELAALKDAAMVFADAYEAGGSLEGYPAWQHVPVVRDGTQHGCMYPDGRGDVFDITYRPQGGSDGCTHC